MATGDPTPSVRWFRDGTEIPNTDTPRYQLSPSGTTLFVEGVIEEDEGQFSCTASNIGGEDEATITLTVHSKSLVVDSSVARIDSLV